MTFLSESLIVQESDYPGNKVALEAIISIRERLDNVIHLNNGNLEKSVIKNYNHIIEECNEIPSIGDILSMISDENAEHIYCIAETSFYKLGEKDKYVIDNYFCDEEDSLEDLRHIISNSWECEPTYNEDDQVYADYMHEIMIILNKLKLPYYLEDTDWYGECYEYKVMINDAQAPLFPEYSNYVNSHAIESLEYCKYSSCAEEIYEYLEHNKLSAKIEKGVKDVTNL